MSSPNRFWRSDVLPHAWTEGFVERARLRLDVDRVGVMNRGYTGAAGSSVAALGSAGPAAEGEFYERFYLTQLDASERKETHKDCIGAVKPEAFADFPLFHTLPDDEKISWTQCHQIANHEPVFLPACLLTLAAGGGLLAQRNYFVPADSTGVAFHTDFGQGLENAFLEWAERQSLLRYWFSPRPCGVPVDTGSWLTGSYRELHRKLSARGNLCLYEISFLSTVRVVLAVYQSPAGTQPGDDGVRFSLGAKAAWSLAEAASGAITELWHSYQFQAANLHLSDAKLAERDHYQQNFLAANRLGHQEVFGEKAQPPGSRYVDATRPVGNLRQALKEISAFSDGSSWYTKSFFVGCRRAFLVRFFNLDFFWNMRTDSLNFNNFHNSFARREGLKFVATQGSLPFP